MNELIRMHLIFGFINYYNSLQNIVVYKPDAPIYINLNSAVIVSMKNPILYVESNWSALISTNYYPMINKPLYNKLLLTYFRGTYSKMITIIFTYTLYR